MVVGRRLARGVVRMPVGVVRVMAVRGIRTPVVLVVRMRVVRMRVVRMRVVRMRVGVVRVLAVRGIRTPVG